MLDKIHSFTHKKEEKGNTITLYDIKVILIKKNIMNDTRL